MAAVSCGKPDAKGSIFRREPLPPKARYLHITIPAYPRSVAFPATGSESGRFAVVWLHVFRRWVLATTQLQAAYPRGL